MGAARIYHADSLRNYWILDAAFIVSNIRSYGVIGPDTYNPQQEKIGKLAKVKDRKDKIGQFNKKIRVE